MLIRTWPCIATILLAIFACKTGHDTSSPKDPTPVQAASKDAQDIASRQHKASFSDPLLEAMEGDPNAPANVVRAWAAAFNRQDIEAVKRVTAEDVITIGIAKCKGEPCTNKNQYIDNFVEPSMVFKVEKLRVRPGPRGTWLAFFESRLPNNDLGSEIVRAYWEITIKDGLITRLANYYDLHDPGTVLLRAGIGDFAFALHNPDPSDRPRIIGMVTYVEHRPPNESSSVSLYSYDPSLDETRLSGSLHKGSCANPGPVIHQLGDLFGGRSDTLLPFAVNSLTTGEYVAAVWSPDKELLACGPVPRVKVTPVLD